MTHQGRHFLQIPGPSPVPDRVLRAMDMPVIDHRSSAFAELAKAVFDGCQKVFRTSGPVLRGIGSQCLFSNFPVKGPKREEDFCGRSPRPVRHWHYQQHSAL